MKISLEEFRKSFPEQKPAIDVDNKHAFLKKFYEDSEPEYFDEKDYQRNEDLVRGQIRKVADKMAVMGFSIFTDLRDKVKTGLDRVFVLNGIKDTMESILFVVEACNESTRKEISTRYKDYKLICGSGTLTNLQKILSEITIGKQGVDAYIALQKKLIIEQIALSLKPEFNDDAIHIIPALTTEIADEWGLLKKDEKEEGSVKHYGQYKEPLLEKLEEEFAKPEVIERLIDAVTAAMLEDLPFYKEGFEVTNAKVQPEMEKVQEHLDSLGFGDLLDYRQLIKMENHKLKEYKANAPEILKGIIIQYLHKSKVLEVPNIEELKLKSKLESGLSDEGNSVILQSDLQGSLNVRKALCVAALETLTQPKEAIEEALKKTSIKIDAYNEDPTKELDRIATLVTFLGGNDPFEEFLKKLGSNLGDDKLVEGYRELVRANVYEAPAFKEAISYAIRNSLKIEEDEETLLYAIEYAIKNEILSYKEIMSLVVKRDIEKGEFNIIKEWADKGLIDKEAYTEFFFINAIRLGDTDLLSKLLKAGCESNTVLSNGKTPILIALEAGQEDTFAILKKNGGDVNFLTKNGNTILFDAIREGNKDLVQRLIKEGAKVNIVGYGGRTPLITALHLDQLEIMEILLNHGAMVEASDSNKNTPLGIAYQAHKFAAMELLLRFGANYKIKMPLKGYKTMTPLLRHAIHDSRFGEAEVLIKSIKDPKEFLEGDDRSALWTAIALKHIELVKTILQKCEILTDKKLLQEVLNKGLIRAAQDRNIEMLKLLVDKGADTNAKDEKGEAAIFTMLRDDEEILKFLLDRVEDINIRDSNGRSLLMLALENKAPKAVELLRAKGIEVKGDELPYAAKAGNMELVIMCREKGADINTPDLEYGKKTPLENALSAGHKELAEYLLKEGASVHGSIKGNDLSVIYAADHGYLDILEKLIEKGANVNSVNYANETALYRVLERYDRSGNKDNQKKIIRFLLEKGADIKIGPKKTPSTECKGAVLSEAIRTRDEEIISLVLARMNHYTKDGLDVPEKYSGTPFITAIEYGNEELVRLFLEQGANPNYRADARAPSTLEYAKNHPNIVQLLQENGASNDVKWQDKSSKINSPMFILAMIGGSLLLGQLGLWSGYTAAATLAGSVAISVLGQQSINTRNSEELETSVKWACCTAIALCLGAGVLLHKDKIKEIIESIPDIALGAYNALNSGK